MNSRPVCGKQWMLSLLVILSVTFSVQGAPASRERTIRQSGPSPASEDPSRLREAAGGAASRLLPPNEELGSADLEPEYTRAASEDQGVSGDGRPGMESEWISGDDDTPSYLLPFENPQKESDRYGKAE
ncbi:uncharacterized protein LOC144694986 [Cetorhinus maximus]